MLRQRQERRRFLSDDVFAERRYPSLYNRPDSIAPMTIEDDKRNCRDRAKAVRDKLTKAERAEAAENLRDAVLGCLRDFAAMPPAVAAGYCPIQGEIDPLPAMKSLAMRGFGLALPAIEDDDEPLLFQEWKAGDALRTGKHGTYVPAQTAPCVQPTVIMTPMLAFDDMGYRLGWGGGYYDRTLESLRQAGNRVIGVGVAFECQWVEQVPREDFDQPLDWIITDKKVRRFDRATDQAIEQG